MLIVLTFDSRIHSACQAGSVLQRKMKSTNGQNLVWEVLERRQWMLIRTWFGAKDYLEKYNKEKTAQNKQTKKNSGYLGDEE